MKSVRSIRAILLCLLLCAAESLGAEQPADSNAKAEPDVAKAVEKGPVPVIYDDFSDGKLWERTGKDPWGRKLPSWTFEIAGSDEPDMLNATKGCICYKYKHYTGISIPSKVAYGTWEWKYRFPLGKTPYTGREGKYLFVEFIRNCKAPYSHRIAAVDSGEYFFGRVADGHTWFGRTGDDKNDPVKIRHGAKGEVQLLHNKPGGWGVGIYTDKLWHTVRITRDKKGRFTLYHDGRVMGDYTKPYKDVTDDTWRTSSTFMVYFKNALSPGEINVDDISIYDAVIPPPQNVPLRAIWSERRGQGPAKLPAMTNYAARASGTTASGSAGEDDGPMASVNMIDGLTTNYDGGKGFAYAVQPDYLTVTLKDARIIGEVYLSLWDTKDALGRPRAYDLELEVSADGNSWTKVAEPKGVYGVQRIVFAPRPVKAIRVRGRNTTRYKGLYVVEIEAYGPPAKYFLAQ